MSARGTPWSARQSWLDGHGVTDSALRRFFHDCWDELDKTLLEYFREREKGPK